MHKSGESLADLLASCLFFLPLIPVILIIWKKYYRREVLNFLMILCLLEFLQGLIGLAGAFPPGLQAASPALFRLLESGILLMVFRMAYEGPAGKIFQFLSIAFFSSLITYYLLRGFGQVNRTVQLLPLGLIALLIAYCLVILIRQNELQILQVPLFWIGTGTIFYYFILMLTLFTVNSAEENQEKTIILGIAGLLKYFFYILSVYVVRRMEEEERKED